MKARTSAPTRSWQEDEEITETRGWPGLLVSGGAGVERGSRRGYRLLVGLDHILMLGRMDNDEASITTTTPPLSRPCKAKARGINLIRSQSRGKMRRALQRTG